MKLSLKSKISFWFLIIILISLVLYGSLIYFVYEFNLRGEKYFNELGEHPGFDPNLIARIKELERFDENKQFFIKTAILPPHIFMTVFFNICKNQQLFRNPGKPYYFIIDQLNGIPVLIW